MQCTTELHSDKERTGIDFGWSAMAGFLKAIIQRSTSSPLWWWYKKMVVQGEKEKSCLLQCSGLALAILPLTEWQMRENRNHLFMWCRCRNESPERWSIQRTQRNSMAELALKTGSPPPNQEAFSTSNCFSHCLKRLSFCLYLICVNHRETPQILKSFTKPSHKGMRKSQN